jgi:predicted transcriptional regulator
MAEVEEYLGGETIECLLCGKRYQVLARHLECAHNTSLDLYRRQFGIPFSRSLTSARARRTFQQSITPQLIEAGRRALRENPPNRKLQARPSEFVPAVVKKRREAPAFHNMVAAPCLCCGEPVITTEMCRGKGVRCAKCAPPKFGRTRAFRLRFKLESEPAVLTPTELQQFQAPFQTIEEVDRYLSRDYIACLICGEQHTILNIHLKKHGITEAGYRLEYGIPHNRPLCSPSYLAMRKNLISPERLERFRAIITEKWRTGAYKNMLLRRRSATVGVNNQCNPIKDCEAVPELRAAQTEAPNPNC